MASANKQRPERKHWLTQNNKLRGRNHENFIQLQRTNEDTVGLKSDSAGNVINSSTKTFIRDVFKLLNKNLNFGPMQKYFNKKKFYNKINDFYWRIKLKAHFKNQTSKPKTEQDIFRKPTDKTWIPKKNHHTIETFVEATNSEINGEIAHIKPPKSSNLLKGEQKALEDLRERDDVVIVNTD